MYNFVFPSHRAAVTFKKHLQNKIYSMFKILKINFFLLVIYRSDSSIQGRTICIHTFGETKSESRFFFLSFGTEKLYNLSYKDLVVVRAEGDGQLIHPRRHYLRDRLIDDDFRDISSFFVNVVWWENSNLRN